MRLSNFTSCIAVATLAVACSPPVSTDAGSDANGADTVLADTNRDDRVATDSDGSDASDARGDEGAIDAGPMTDASADTASDAASSDASFDAASDADVTVVDASADSGASDDAMPDAPPACEYIDSPSTLADCSGNWIVISEWVNIAGPTPYCPPYYGYDTTSRDTVDELLTALGCSGACAYRAESAVSFLHCGHRDEYTSYRSDAAGCHPVLMFSDGHIYASIDEYNAANPCPM